MSPTKFHMNNFKFWTYLIGHVWPTNFANFRFQQLLCYSFELRVGLVAKYF
jgi:hypothetical protein